MSLVKIKMTDEQIQPRMYSAEEIARGVSYLIVDVHYLCFDCQSVLEIDEERLDDALEARATLSKGLAQVLERAYMPLLSRAFPDEFIAKMRAKGIDTTHLE